MRPHHQPLLQHFCVLCGEHPGAMELQERHGLEYHRWPQSVWGDAWSQKRKKRVPGLQKPILKVCHATIHRTGMEGAGSVS